jgi:hypothetical protein
LQVADAFHPNFQQFNLNITDSIYTPFRLIGNASSIAKLSIGTITLDPIMVNVSEGFTGFQGLKGLTTIQGVDVVGGTPEAVLLSINTTIINKSQLNLAAGDLSMQLSANGSMLGTALLPNLTLNMGTNLITASSNFMPNDSPEGLATLDAFVGKKNTTLNIAGYSSSTNVSSLLPAFESTNVPVVLPGLTEDILSTGSLEILPTTFVSNNMSNVKVNLVNPFTADLTITNIQSTVTSHGLYLGSINTTTNFPAKGHATSASPSLGLDMFFDPPTLFTLTRVLAVQAGEDPTPLDGVVQLGGYQYVTATNADGSKLSSRELDEMDRRIVQKRNIYT